MTHRPCEACRWHIGAGCCRINMEDECGEGGCYELWEPCASEERPELESRAHRWTRRIVIGLLIFEIGCIVGRFLLLRLAGVIW